MLRSALLAATLSFAAHAASPDEAVLPPMPAGLPLVQSPEDNPTTPEKAVLGAKLFFDKRLSKDGSMACAQCHLPDKAYTSGQALDAKVGGVLNKRNSPTLTNLGFNATSFYWDGRMPTLEAVCNAAWKGQLAADPEAVVRVLNAQPGYKWRFDKVFGTGGATVDTVPQALAAFVRTLETGNAPFDRFLAGDKSALSKDAQAGWAVFQKAQCTGCHQPPFFTDHDFHAVGVGDDAGRREVTRQDADLGKLKTPSLRNVALTAPYFHDGSAKTLDEAIAVMARGGTKPNLDVKLKPAKLTPKELASLKAFLEALTGEVSWSKAPELP